MELDRLRYSLSKYLRTRLRKVERDALHVLASGQEMEGRLSDKYGVLCYVFFVFSCCLVGGACARVFALSFMRVFFPDYFETENCVVLVFRVVE